VAALLGLFGAVLGITFGILGAAFGFLWRVIFSPLILIVLIVWIVFRVRKKPSAK